MVSISIHPPSSVPMHQGARKRQVSVSDDDLSMASTESFRPPKRVRFSDQEITKEIRRKVIVSALEEQNATGKSEQYEELRRKFSIKATNLQQTDSAELAQILSALTQVVSQLDRQCNSLVSDILQMNWAGREDGFQRTYLAFVMHLISAHPRNVGRIVQMMVKHLTYEMATTARKLGGDLITRQSVFKTAHNALKAILDIVPTAWSPLFSAISATYPHKDEKKIHQTIYIVNLLKIMSYVPGSKTKILGLIFEKVMQIDVEIQINLDELEEGQGEELSRQLEDSTETIPSTRDSGIGDDLEDSEPDSELEDDDNIEDGETRTVEMIRGTVDKIDSMLSILFSYFSRCFPENTSLKPSQEDVENFELLLHFFEEIILPTFKSQYTQFLVFWAAQKSTVFTDIFLGMLVERAMDNSKPQVARQAAAAYIASFVARAQQLDRKAIRSVVNMLCLWLEKYLRDREIECKGPDVRRFGGFYAVTQAVMYIFCFRWRDLRGKAVVAADDDEFDNDPYYKPTSWAPGLQVIERLIMSRFNPLKVCSPAVVNQFAKVAHHFNFVYCFSVMEQNKRGNIFTNGKAGTGTNLNEATQLETYFPFDPFKLPVTKCWVDPLYVHWQRIPGLDVDDNEGTDTLEEDESDDSSLDDEDEEQ